MEEKSQEMIFKENIQRIYNNPLNELITTKENAPVVTSILMTLKNQDEPMSLQHALNILRDCISILPKVTKV